MKLLKKDFAIDCLGSELMTDVNNSKPVYGNPREPVPVPLENAKELGIGQVIDQYGEPTGTIKEPDISDVDLKRIYQAMCMTRAIDDRGWKLQRSGRIAFWIPLKGQEAIATATTCAAMPSDWIFRSHRELSVWLLRGKKLETMFAQFFGAVEEPLMGRRLPCLIGSREINLISSTTQVGAYLPHAVGAAWAAKLKGASERVICFIGDGSASRGEFTSALNFAGIHKPPVLIICVNNGWAVTTPLDCQTAIPNFAARGDAYGVRNLRIDGNDPLAVYSVTKEMLNTMPEQGAALVEAITYRRGYHTSSDNPELYRMEEESKLWKVWDPISRMKAYLTNKKLWSESDESLMNEQHQEEIQRAVDIASKLPLADPASQFDHVFEQSNWMLDKQKERVLSELSEK